MSVTDQLVSNADSYADQFGPVDLPTQPRKRVAIVACMDARLDPVRIFGLEAGDAHVIANAGGAVTDDVIRSLAISQHRLGTEEIILLHHSECGMLGFTSDEFVGELELATGIRPTWAVEAFSDVEEDVRQSMARIGVSPFVPRKESVRGFVFDVRTGTLREVSPRS